MITESFQVILSLQSSVVLLRGNWPFVLEKSRTVPFLLFLSLKTNKEKTVLLSRKTSSLHLQAGGGGVLSLFHVETCGLYCQSQIICQ